MNTLQTMVRLCKLEVDLTVERADISTGCIVTQAAMVRFRSSPHRELRALTCELSFGRLHIDGQVTAYYMKQMAQETIRSVNGVNVVVNRVIVQAAD